MPIGKGKLETSIDMHINGTAVIPYQEITLLGTNIDSSHSLITSVKYVKRPADK